MNPVAPLDNPTEMRHHFTDEQLRLAMRGAGDAVWEIDLASDIIRFDPLQDQHIAGCSPDLASSFPKWLERIHQAWDYRRCD